MKKFKCLTVGLLGVFLAGVAFGQAAVVGKVSAATGTVSLSSAGRAARAVAVGAPVHQGDVIVTGAGSTAGVRFSDGSVIKVGENSKCAIRKKGTKTSDATKLHLFSGKMRIKVKGDRVARADFEVSTPTAVAGVRGTDFLLQCLPGPVTRVVVFKGIVSVRSLMREVTRETNVPAGRSARVSAGQRRIATQKMSRAETQQVKASLPMEEEATEEGEAVPEEIIETTDAESGETGVTQEVIGEISGEVSSEATQSVITEDIQEVAAESLPEPPGVPASP